MFAIDMGGCDVVLGADWLCTLGLVTMEFKELHMSFTTDGRTHTLKRLQSGSPEIISSHHMENILKKGHSGIIAQFHAIKVMDNPTPQIHPNSQLVFTKYK